MNTAANESNPTNESSPTVNVMSAILKVSLGAGAALLTAYILSRMQQKGEIDDRLDRIEKIIRDLKELKLAEGE